MKHSYVMQIFCQIFLLYIEYVLEGCQTGWYYLPGRGQARSWEALVVLLWRLSDGLI